MGASEIRTGDTLRKGQVYTHDNLAGTATEKT